MEVNKRNNKLYPLYVELQYIQIKTVIRENKNKQRKLQ